MADSSYSKDKDINDLCVQAISSGLCKPERGTKHWCLVRGDGFKQTIPGSPSDFRAADNFKSQMRRFLPAMFNLNYVRTEKPKVRVVEVEKIVEVIKEVPVAFDPHNLSIDDLQRLIAVKQQEKRDEDERLKAGRLEQLASVEQEIADLEAMLQSAKTKRTELKTALGMLDPSGATKVRGNRWGQPANTTDEMNTALDDAVFKISGAINLVATAEKHGIKSTYLLGKQARIRGFRIEKGAM